TPTRLNPKIDQCHQSMVGTFLYREYITCGYVPLVVVSVVGQRELNKKFPGSETTPLKWHI
ncbi:MAG: hypothetical protein OET79_03135, partial [Nitrospirota bacterium]|nr:hypothetical protein [Nitrospirota bacterium]